MKILYVDPVVYVDGEGNWFQAFVRAFEPGSSTMYLTYLSNEGDWNHETVPQVPEPAPGDPAPVNSWFACAGATVRHVPE